MSYQIVASGGKTDIYSIDQYDEYFEEGEAGVLQLKLSASLPESVLTGIEAGMRNQGVHDARVVQSGQSVNIYFRKGIPPLVIIIGVISALIITLAIILIAWHIFRQVVPEGLQGTVGTALIVGVIALVSAVAWQRLRS